jgi:PIN domain nuclease of toxin-antitoxin system
LSLVLDTHAWVWFLQASPQLGRRARSLIERALAKDRLVISAMTPWEIALLAASGRLPFARDVGEWLQEQVSIPGTRLQPLSIEIAAESTRLPGRLHGDPADRIIVATARCLELPLVTADARVLNYGDSGHVIAIDATH